MTLFHTIDATSTPFPQDTLPDDRSRPPAPDRGAQAATPLQLRRPRAFTRLPGWEYRDFVIRVDVHEEGRNADKRAAADINPLIRYFLRRIGAHGWEPDEPVDFDSLFHNDRVAYTSVEGRRWIFEVSSVTVRLRRAILS